LIDDFDASMLANKKNELGSDPSLWTKKGKTGPTLQLFAGFTDEKPVVIGLYENINLARSVYLW